MILITEDEAKEWDEPEMRKLVFDRFAWTLNI